MTSVDSGGLGVTSSGAPEAFGASSSRTPRRGSRLHRLRLGWLQEDSQEHERWGYLERTTHPQDMVRHPEESDPEFRRSRARGKVKMSCEMNGMTQLASEWGLVMKGNIFADSSAALGIAKRRGSGKMRHVKIGTLWIQ